MNARKAKELYAARSLCSQSMASSKPKVTPNALTPEPSSLAVNAEPTNC